MAPSDIGSLFGAGLIGIVIASTIFGVYNVQVYSYFSHYSKDKLWIKLMVVAIWSILALQYSLDLHAIYTYLIDDFDQDTKLAVATWDWTSYVLLTSITSVTVQFFFARRLFQILHNKTAKYVAVGLILTFSLLGFTVGVYLMWQRITLHTFSAISNATWGVDVWLGANVICDLSITSFMCYTLHTNRTGVKSTDRLINKLMAYSVQTGAMTSFTEIACLVTFSVAGYHYGHVVVVFPLSGLYATSFLANLHARAPNTPGDTKRGVITGSEMTTTTMTMDISNMFRNPSASNAEFSDPTSTKFDENVQDEDLLVTAPRGPKNSSSV
jgi:hypothetical protein